MDKTIELVNSIKDIQAMPNVIVKVLNLMKKPTMSMQELGDIVIYDQSLSVKIIALVNSAYYGFSQQISSINIALSLLGIVKVKNIIVAVAMRPMMSSSGAKDLWIHSIRVAAGCEYLANVTKAINPDEAFISGFIHDIGKVVLQTANPNKYTKVIEMVNRGSDIIETERKFFDSDHVKTGSLLVKRWQLPVLLTNTVLYHHNPKLSSIPIVCNLVNFVDCIVKEDFDVSKLNKEALKALNLNIEDVNDIRSVIKQKGDMLVSELM